ncbi:MAG: hypothetical protein U9P63_00695, partial [Patescibacteria group bacterium]|nr:hypothetical protein [Patescibacteria group bacterium]
MEELKGKTESVKYISLKEASDLCSYSQDYLSLRARQGKIKAVKRGRNWITTEEWIKEYIKQVEDFNKKPIKVSKPLISKTAKDNLREIKEILKNDLLIIPNLIRASYSKLKGVEIDFGDLTIFFKNIIFRFGCFAAKAPIFINKLVSWLKQTRKEIKLRYFQLSNMLGDLISASIKGLDLPKKARRNLLFNRNLDEKAGPFGDYTAARLFKNLGIYQKKICRPKFALSAFLIILIFLGSSFLFSAGARASLAKWANKSVKAFSDAKGEVANLVYRQSSNTIAAVYKVSDSIKDTGNAIVSFSANAVSRAPQFIEKTTQNIEELPFLTYSTVRATLPSVENKLKAGVSSLQGASADVLTAVADFPGKIISFSYSSKQAFERASQKNEQLKLALKSKSRQVFAEFRLKINNLPVQIGELERNLSQKTRQTTYFVSDKIELISKRAETLPRQIARWGRGQKMQGKIFLAELTHLAKEVRNRAILLGSTGLPRFADASLAMTKQLNEIARDAYHSLSDIPNSLSDMLSDTPKNLVNKAKNAFSLLQKSLNEKRSSLSLKFNEARLITGLTLDEIENIAVTRPIAVIKISFEKAGYAKANLFDSIGKFGKKTVQISKKVKNKLGDTYIKIAEFVIPGYSVDETEELLPRRAVITKTEEPVIQEVVKQVQQITPKVITKEITKEKIVEITETVQSADLTDINQDLDNLSLRITNLANQISSRIDYTTPSYAPVYVPSSGIQVAGHALLTTLNVSGSGALGGSLSVHDNASFGNAKDTKTTLNVYSTATFNESAAFNSGLSASSLSASGNLAVGGNATVSGTFSAATTTLTQLTVNKDLLVSGNATTTGSQAFSGTVSVADLLTATSTQIIATTTGVALTVQQNSVGDIVNIKDGAASVFTIADGGPISINASSTSPIINLTASSTDTHLLFKLAGAGPFLNITNNSDTSRLYINNGGKIGVSQSLPSYRLDVQGTETDDNFFRVASSTENILVVKSTGNVGIGTTSPSVKFSVGGDAGDTTGHGYFTGGLGVGTVNTTANSFQVGQCVTGDTLLKRRRRRKRKDGSYEYYFENIRIDQIKEGDEILTLDDKTGKLKVSKVKKLMYMGKKPIVEIITALGRKIRTTGNHPYFVRANQPKIKKPKIGIFYDNANLFYAQKKAGW